MSISSVLSYAAAYFSIIVAAAVLLRDRRSAVHWLFAAGLFCLAGEEILRGVALSAVSPSDVVWWHKRIVALSVFIPGIWLGFSVGYARANSAETLSRWKWAIAATSVV